MRDIKDVRTIESAIGVLIPEFDLVEYGDTHERECYCLCDIIEPILGGCRMLIACNEHLKRTREERRIVVGDNPGKRHCFRWVAGRLNVRAASDWWEGYGLTRKSPLNEGGMSYDLFFSLQPKCHLSELIFEVC